MAEEACRGRRRLIEQQTTRAGVVDALHSTVTQALKNATCFFISLFVAVFIAAIM